MRRMQKHLQRTPTASVNVTKTQLASLLTILEEVPDPRVTATVDHALADILTIALCTILCGGRASTTWKSSARSGWIG